MDLIEDLLLLSKNAAKLARKLSDWEGKVEQFTEIAAQKVRELGIAIIQDEITRALIEAPEFAYPPLEDRLRAVFSSPEIIKTRREGVRIAAELAGTPTDLWEGIERARQSLGIGHTLDIQRASVFWKERIYRPAREGLQRPRSFKKLSKWSYYKGYKGRRTQETFDYQMYAREKYDATIAARLGSWAGKAPFWILIDQGNLGGNKGGTPYPTNGPTNFVKVAQARLNQLYRQIMIDITEQFMGALSQEVVSFLENPVDYEPGTILGNFEYAGRAYTITAQAGGEIGVALSK